MSQLPPKIPNSTNNLPNFAVPRAQSSFGTSGTLQEQPSWVDDFFDFTTSRREAQRNPTELVTFLDPRASLPDGDFDGLDEEQLLSMFSDDDAPTVPPTLPNPSTPPTSDNNSSSVEEKVQPIPIPTPVNDIKVSEEAQSTCHEDNMLPPLPPTTEPIADPKRVKRILANRQSAQRSRVRKLQYISELERSVTCLQTEVSALSPRVAFFDHQRSVLAIGNSALKQRIAALAQDKIFKDAHQEALRKEIERLRQVYHHQQNFQKMEYANGVATTPGNTSVTNHDPHGYANNELHS